MVDVHELQNCGAVVCDGDVIVGRDHHLVQTLWTEGGPQGTGDCSSCQYVTLFRRKHLDYTSEGLKTIHKMLKY